MHYRFMETLPVYGNSIIRDKYAADPAVMVHNGMLYFYTGHDEPPAGKEWYFLKEWLCYFTTDMVHWTEHPSPLNVAVFAWAKADAWTSQVIEHNSKFYWHVTVEHGSIGGKSIGVDVSDISTGPFKDARGSALVINDMTESTGISWDDIAPRYISTTRAKLTSTGVIRCVTDCARWAGYD